MLQKLLIHVQPQHHHCHWLHTLLTLYNNTTTLGPHDKTLVQPYQHFCMILAQDQPLTKYLGPCEAAPSWHASFAELRP
jgi:hypothetical protein